MTNSQKILLLKETIQFLYEKEGRSISYISRLLLVDRRTLSQTIRQWEFRQANIKRLSPSNQKFANKHRNLVKSRLDNNFSISSIAKELGVSRYYLTNIINKDAVMDKARQDYKNRIDTNALTRKTMTENNSSYKYEFDDLEGEIWKPILGYDGYQISNMGRIKCYTATYSKYHLIQAFPNKNNNRMYVMINKKNLQVARLVGFAFVDGWTEEKSTINHIDGDVGNNKASNLEWMSQSDNKNI